MNDNISQRDESPITPAWLLWTTTLIVGTVFFISTQSFSLTSDSEWFVSRDWTDQVEGGFDQLTKSLTMPAIGLLGIFLLMREGRYSVRLDDWLVVAVLAYVAMCALSLTWSINGSLTIRRTALAAVWCIAALGIARQFTMREIMQMAFWITTSFLILGIIAEIRHNAFRLTAADYRYAGTAHPNAQGINCALACLSSFGMAMSSPRHKKIYLFFFALGFVFMLLTKSRMSLMALMAGGAVVVLLRWSLRSIITTLFAGAAMACAVLLAVQFADKDFLETIAPVVSLGRDKEIGTLTGRLPLWGELTPYIEANPLLGYGYRAFWNYRHTAELAVALDGWQIPHAHSGYVDTILDFGIPAALYFIVASFLAACRAGSVFRQIGGAPYGFACAVFVFALLDSFLESTFVIPNVFLFTIVCAAFHLAFRKGEPSASMSFAPVMRPSP